MTHEETTTHFGRRFAAAMSRAGHPATWDDGASRLVVGNVNLSLDKDRWQGWHFFHDESKLGVGHWRDGGRVDRRDIAPALRLLTRVDKWQKEELIRRAVQDAANSLVNEFGSDDMGVDAITAHSVNDGDIWRMKLKIELGHLVPYEARAVLLAVKQALEMARKAQTSS